MGQHLWSCPIRPVELPLPVCFLFSKGFMPQLRARHLLRFAVLACLTICGLLPSRAAQGDVGDSLLVRLQIAEQRILALKPWAASSFLARLDPSASLQYDSERIESDTTYALAVVRYALARRLFDAGFFMESGQLCAKALPVFRGGRDVPLAFDCLILQVGNQMNMGVFEEAYPTMLSAYALAMSQRDSLLIAAAQEQLGKLYLSQGNMAAAELYLEDAVLRTRKLQHPGWEHDLANRLNHLARAYQGEGHSQMALETVAEAISICNQMDDPVMLAQGYIIRGDAYTGLHQYTRAEASYLEALILSEEKRQFAEKAQALKQLGMLRYTQGRFAEATDYLQQSLQIAQWQRMRLLQSSLLLCLSRATRSVSLLQSVGYLEQHLELNDSITHRSVQQQMNALHVRYETELKQSRIEVQQLQLRRAATFRTILIASIVLALTIVVLLILALRRNRRRSRQLADLNGKLAHRNQELAALSSQLRALNEDLATLNRNKDSFFAHDTRGAASAIRLSLTQLDEHLDRLSKESVTSHISALRKGAESLVNLLNTLLEFARFQLDTSPLPLANFDIVPFVHQALEITALERRNKRIEIRDDLPPEAPVLGNKDTLFAIIRNLVMNAIKFSPLDSELEVWVRIQGDGVVFGVRDHGMGMSPDMVAKLGRMGEHIVRQGTCGEKGTGLGLVMCYDMAKKNAARIEVQSAEGQGTTMLLIMRPADDRPGEAPAQGAPVV